MNTDKAELAGRLSVTEVPFRGVDLWNIHPSTRILPSLKKNVTCSG